MFLCFASDWVNVSPKVFLPRHSADRDKGLYCLTVLTWGTKVYLWLCLSVRVWSLSDPSCCAPGASRFCDFCSERRNVIRKLSTHIINLNNLVMKWLSTVHLHDTLTQVSISPYYESLCIKLYLIYLCVNLLVRQSLCKGCFYSHRRNIIRQGWFILLNKKVSSFVMFHVPYVKNFWLLNF